MGWELKPKRFKKEHYPDLLRIWQHYGWQPCPLSCLPKVGYVAEDENGTMVAALFMYASSDEVAFMDWGVGSLDHDHDEVMTAFGLLVNKLRSVAVKMGCKFIFSMSKIRGFQSILLDNGFTVAERNTTSFVMPLIGEDMAFIKD